MVDLTLETAGRVTGLTVTRFRPLPIPGSDGSIMKTALRFFVKPSSRFAGLTDKLDAA